MFVYNPKGTFVCTLTLCSKIFINGQKEEEEDAEKGDNRSDI